ncbi:hypothetical protein PV10_03708 [Exophiala mesophila]|uniref:Uncharacterized protein n=1 Tax=Exophiala mesophila TaxID=212818 RepID=A0A0D2A033_EXOME|nr:uncharacterized protein PV10_03708 [Exophiala mesophila]KIV92408.1 hypothetical protein PV10_03708 [Exophiala mesophila]
MTCRQKVGRYLLSTTAHHSIRTSAPSVHVYQRWFPLCTAAPHHAFTTLTPRNVDWRTGRLNVEPCDTIYALSTAHGRAAVAVIRISGPACLHVYGQLCPGKTALSPRRATLRRLHSPDPDGALSLKDRILDHGALVLYFPAPNTVTGEDILELHLHGGPAIVRSTLRAISQCGQSRDMDGSRTKLRHAEPGEFTKRAFYNGRLDLTQAEALGETLAAETEQQRRLAVSGAQSGLAKRYDDWRHQLLYARGELEALIDFSEDQHFDESPAEFMRSVTEQVRTLKSQIDLHLRNASKGELLRNGISIALLGAPNAGKSSLLNRIVGREAAIVSAEEGTTRDIVDVTVDIAGWLCRLGDMAGLRGHGVDVPYENQLPIGHVEQEGIRRARERALQSDVVVVLLSLERTKDDGLFIPVNGQVLEAFEECHAAGKTILIALNKTDLAQDDKSELECLQSKIRKTFPNIPSTKISLVSCRNAAMENSATGNGDPGGIQAFLSSLTGTFTDLTTASSGSDASTKAMTPAEAQSYWTASLSVTHRQSIYLEECRGYLDEFLAQSEGDLDNDDGDWRPNTEASVENVDSHDGRLTRRNKDTSLTITPGSGSVDIVTAAEHLRFAAQCLARITGRGEGGDVEDVLGVVFEKFCVGK